MRLEQFNDFENFSYGEVAQFYEREGFSIEQMETEIHKLSYTLFKRLQKFRTMIGRPVRFTSLTEGVHSRKSMHYHGKAADIVIGGRGSVNWNKVFQAAVECGFKGIGFYPFNGPFMHVDVRPGEFKCWKRLQDGSYVGII